MPPVASLLSLLTPQSGALDNARQAVRTSRAGAVQRTAVALLQARGRGCRSWAELRPGVRGLGGPHAVHFPRDDADLVGRLTDYVAEGLAEGETCVVLATPAHLAGLRSRLRLAGLDGDVERLLVAREAAPALAALLQDGQVDAERFEVVVGGLLRGVVAAGGRVRAFGELVGLLDGAGDLDGALRLERLWNGLQEELGFPLLCAYPGRADGDRADQARVCAVHSHLATG